MWIRGVYLIGVAYTLPFNYQKIKGGVIVNGEICHNSPEPRADEVILLLVYSHF
jgi:hypothetical protein